MEEEAITLVKVVLVLLALLSTTSGCIELVADSTKESSTFLLLGLSSLWWLLLLVLVGTFASEAVGSVLEEVHDF